MKSATKNPAAIILGRLGGKAGTGKSKARTSEQARAAAKARWEAAASQNGRKGGRPTKKGKEQ